VDARDSSGSITPLYLAAKSQNARYIKDNFLCLRYMHRNVLFRAAKRLIEEGANVNGKVGKTDKTMR
jgi:hypothetical protein